MRWLLFAIKDTAVGCFNRPFCARHRGEAMRLFTDEVNSSDAQNPLAKHPKDFELYSVGMFDDSDGSLIASPCERLAAGVDVRLNE